MIAPLQVKDLSTANVGRNSVGPPVAGSTQNRPHHAHHGKGANNATMLALVALDPHSVIADAASELTQSLSSKVQERSIRDRRVSTGGVYEGLSREEVMAALRQLRGGQDGKEGENAQSMLALARRVLKQPAFARQLVQEHTGGDSSSQYLSLLEVAELIRDGSAGQDPGGMALEAVMEAAHQLMAEDADLIHADLNTLKASSSLPSPEQSAAFRTAYRDSVLASDSLGDTLQHILKVVSAGQEGDFDRVLDTLREALGLDLAAARPSTEAPRLHYLVSDLSHLKVIGTVIDSCAKLGKTLGQRHGMPAFKASDLASDLVSLSGERWVDASRVSRLADRYGASRPAACTVDFLTGLKENLRQMPVQVFASPEARQTVLDAAQMAIDDAIEREESGA